MRLARDLRSHYGLGNTINRTVVGVAVWCAIAGSASLATAEDAPRPDFQREVLPIIKSHCVRCHGPDKQESRVRLDNLSTDLISDRAAAETWHEVLNAINGGEMPPDGEPQLATDQRRILTTWVSAAVRRAIETGRKTSGRVVLRRLNRVEYQNTMTDLLGLEMDYVRDLPPDPRSRDGFKNDGLALRISPLQLEYYLATARRALDRVIVSGPVPKVHEYTFTESNVRGWLRGIERANQLGRQQAFLATMVKDYPESGEFLVRVKLKAELKPERGFPLLEASLGYRPDTKILFREIDTVEITTAEVQVHEFRGRVENHPLPVRGQGKFPGLVVRLRNRYDDGSPLPKGKNDKQKGTDFPDEPLLPTVTIQSVEFRGPVFDQWPPATHRRILFPSELQEKDEAGYAGEVLKRFMDRAYRRPSTAAEVKALVEFFRTIRDDFPSFEEAIRETLAMVLIRPEFLYLIEPAGDEKQSISDWELAARLSYFLWSTMPDERLRQRAAAGKLRETKVLRQEVERLLADPRSRRFADQFTDQWLHLNVVDRVAVDRDYYPGFDDRLKGPIRREPQALFAELLGNDLSALTLLKSDFTMLNETLARHYGVPNVFGRTFRRVALRPEDRRGGLLGQAAVLLSNSTGADSHAVRRAVWIRDRLLNDPPAPPPPDVPALEEADPKFRKLSVREQLEVHRGTESCAACHRGIDPWGIALEHFDAVGRWRDEVRRRVGKKFEKLPVQARDTLPNGTTLDGAEQLKNYLAGERRDDFARALVVRLLTYAAGRRLELSDQAAVDSLTKKFIADDFRLRGLVHAVVASRPFQTK